MILSSHGIIGSSIGQVDADALAFFARVTGAGGTLSATEQTAVNKLVLDLKANSLWTPMKAIYPMVGASAAACAQNLKSSSFTGTFTSGWTFASTGVTPNGTSAYMNTALNPTISLTTPSHLSYYSRSNTNTNTDQIDIGISNFWLSLWYKSIGFNNLLARNQSVSVLLDGGVVTDSRGFGITTKIGTTAKIFFNNVQKDSQTDIVSIFTNQSIFIAAFNSGGPNLFSNRECAFASIGDGLTDTEASDFYDAVQAFQTTLSRQV
jgi:hypothetical protein